MEDKERVEAGQGRKGSPRKELEKRILFASEASESLRNSESEGLGSTDGVRRESSPMDQRSARSKYTMRMDSGPTKPGRSDARRNSSPEDSIPAMSKDSDQADGMGKKDSPGKKSEKRTLFVSQTEETSESLRYPESNESTSEDSVTQGRTESSANSADPVTSVSITEQSMAKGCIEPVDENASESETRLGYFGLGLHDTLEVPEADKLLEVIGQIEGRTARILLDTGCSTYVLSSRFAERNGIPGIRMRPRPNYRIPPK